MKSIVLINRAVSMLVEGVIRRKCICFIFIVLLLTSCTQKNAVSNGIFQFLEKQPESEDVRIRLSDFTEFDWDRVVIFEFPATAAEINREVGINYQRAIDLQAGMIFVRGNQIVHEEEFKNAFLTFEPNKYCPLVIYPSEEGPNGVHFATFDKSAAVFKVEKGEKSGKSVYWLRPGKTEDKKGNQGYR